MSSGVLLEALGYGASALVTLSLMMRSIVRLRWLSLAGAVCFAVYGVLITAYPVAVLNVAIIGINLWHLGRLRRTGREAFALIEASPDSPYLDRFLTFYRREIQRTQPDFEFAPDRPATVLIVLRDLVPAGVVILDPPSGGVGRVRLDFVTPAYRDLQVGTYLFRTRSADLNARGYRELRSTPGTDMHRRYLEAMGFTADGTDYRRSLADDGSPSG